MWKFIKLIIAGGYDSRVQENIDVMQDMKDKVKALGLEEHVIFKPNISDSERWVSHEPFVLFLPCARTHLPPQSKFALHLCLHHLYS
jgi:hypothetical protein